MMISSAAASGGGNSTREKTGDIQIHYGLIASGNQVIKNATLRDRLNDSLGGNVLCIEMEAAGLMDDFPCIVIRGICDYADSSKNDEWQEYAAATAAAYAKYFLEWLQPIAVHKEAPMKDVILNRVYDNLAKVTSILEREEDLKILEWLTPIEYGPQQNDIVQKRQPGTGQWLLNSSEYYGWLQNRKQILFCPGIPGAGKTFLTSIVVDHLLQSFGNTSAAGIAYIYFNFKNEQTIHNILASLLKQLARRQYSLPTAVKELHERYKGNKTWPPTNDIAKALQSVAAMYSRVFIVVDALDECQGSDYCRNNFLSVLFCLYTECGINIFATSRHIQEIIEQFKLYGCTTLEIRAHDEDLRAYLDSQIEQSRREILRRNREAIKTTIIDVVDGMFLLARLHFQAVENKTSSAKLNQALKAFVVGEAGEAGETAYNLAYGEVMRRIDGQNSDFKRLAHQTLSWIVCAERPLTKLELQHALAVEPEVDRDRPELDEDNLPEINDMVSVCAGLVTIDEESNIVRLIHYTTQEYFHQTRKEWIRDAQAYITKVCVTYLSFKTLNTRSVAQSSVLYYYASTNWGHHARKSSTDGTQLIVSDLLKSETKVSVSKSVFRPGRRISNNRFRPRSTPARPPTQTTGMHLAAHFGLREPIQLLVREGAELDAEDEDGYTPLSRAAITGHTNVAEFLVGEGANLEAEGNIYGQTPLLLAAISGHAAVVELLVREGANLKAKDIEGHMPLSLAARHGHMAIVELLNKALDSRIE
ncbi:hypothetical protein TWF506_008791 [Arthrobotrys conoides]|uniref:Ankyrin repeat protein n=1 Tax=Arthrobotrys conoides TaxID=74498 RepID=A0AAN8NF54_9PEZI